MWAALSPLVLWLAAIAAYAYEDGMNLFQWMGRFSQVVERPFAIGWTAYTLKYMLGSLLLYGCGIALGDLTDSTLAAQLQEYLPQSAEGTTKTIDADGNVTFRGLELGLYLIVQTEASKGYEPINPFLVSLPMAEDGKWNYAVDASPKVGAYTPTKPDTPPTPPTPPTPDYPDTPTPPDNPDNPVSPGNPDNPVAPGHPDNPVAPGHPDHPVAPGNPDSPVLPGHPDSSAMSGLPQTGQLNWPVPVLAVSGVVLFAFGWALDRKYRTV